jgi:hypothetical protein
MAFPIFDRHTNRILHIQLFQILIY